MFFSIYELVFEHARRELVRFPGRMDGRCPPAYRFLCTLRLMSNLHHPASHEQDIPTNLMVCFTHSSYVSAFRAVLNAWYWLKLWLTFSPINQSWRLIICYAIYICVCVCVSWGRGWGLGGMELRVGSNIMIHFLYILLLPIWHMYFYIIHC